jgi:glutamate/aspartate transport system permease protein
MKAFDVSAILSTWPYLMQGLWFTIQITLVGVAGGIVLGSLLAVARLSRNRLLSTLATAYVNLMRSIPLILVIFWVFFLVPWAVGWVTRSGRPVPVGASLTIFTTFVLFEAAYYAEIVRAGFRSISPGQYSASEALGLSKLQAYTYILFPQAIRNVLPILLTQTIVLFQDTSLVYVISATDLLGAATKIAQRDGRLVEMYLTVGVIYFVVCFAASQFVKQLQGRLAYGVRR